MHKTYHNFFFMSFDCCPKPLICLKLNRFPGAIDFNFPVVWQRKKQYVDSLFLTVLPYELYK